MIVRWLFSFIACLALVAPQVVLAQSVPAAHTKAIAQILVDNACQMDEDALEEAFIGRVPDTSGADFRAAALELGADGTVGVVEGEFQFVLYSAPCGDGSETPYERFLAIMGENGCKMSEDTADRILVDAGFGKDTVSFWAEAMITLGTGQLEGDVFTILPPHCTAN